MLEPFSGEPFILGLFSGHHFSWNFFPRTFFTGDLLSADFLSEDFCPRTFFQHLLHLYLYAERGQSSFTEFLKPKSLFNKGLSFCLLLNQHEILH